MIAFPCAKINLGLSIISRRTDGYHDLESVFYPLPLRDVLEIVPDKTTTVTESGIPLAGKPTDNLVLLAYALLKKEFPEIPPASIFLYKAIPSGAGLGGGSSDAAAMLKLMNDLFTLGLSSADLHRYALQLGSDCPFFLQSSPCYVLGRGEKLEKISLDLSAYSFLLLHPGLSVSTAWAFTQIRPSHAPFHGKALVSEPVHSWRHRLHNDFEPPVFRKYPELALIKDQLYEAGALYASLTGSGSSLYGIFKKGKRPTTGISSTAGQTWLP